MKSGKRAAALLIFLLSVCTLSVSVRATEETRQQLEQAEQERNNTQNQLDETEENLDNLNEQRNSLQGTLSNLNTELSQVSNNLSDLETRIADKEAEIEDINNQIDIANQELADAIAVKDTQYETMKLQIKFMYEKSDYLFLEMAFSSKSFSEFLNRADYIEQLSAYEAKTLQNYKDIQAAIEAKAAELKVAKEV